MPSSRRDERGAALSVGPRTVVVIGSTTDIVAARERGRALAVALGFTGAPVLEIITAISELAHVVEHAKRGQLVLDHVEQQGRHGVVVVAHGEGPGIADVAKALSADVTAVDPAVGPGLHGVRRLMDDFEVCRRPRHGTTVTVRKWLR